MRKLRRFWTEEQTAAIYKDTYAGVGIHAEHRERAQHTIEVAQRLIDVHGLSSVADLSCGDGTIVKALRDLSRVTMSDVSEGVDLDVGLDELDSVDLFIFTETLEHLEEPWRILNRIADKTTWLLLSCPYDESPGIGNIEHYWTFDETDIGGLLAEAGFDSRTVSWHLLSNPTWTYTYQIWTVKK